MRIPGGFFLQHVAEISYISENFSECESAAIRPMGTWPSSIYRGLVSHGAQVLGASVMGMGRQEA